MLSKVTVSIIISSFHKHFQVNEKANVAWNMFIIIQQILLNIITIAQYVGAAATLGCHSENIKKVKTITWSNNLNYASTLYEDSAQWKPFHQHQRQSYNTKTLELMICEVLN